MFIEDILAAYMSCDALSVVPGEVFNIGSGQQHTVSDVVNTIVQLTGANVTPQRGHPQKWPNEPRCSRQIYLKRKRCWTGALFMIWIGDWWLPLVGSALM